jgi:hypothetical protein
MILDGFYTDARTAIQNAFLGKRVRMTDCATTVPDDLEWIEGVVEEIEFGSFGYEGEGDALFRMVEVTDAGYIEYDFNGRLGERSTEVHVGLLEGRGTVMVSNKYTKIEVLD